MTFSSTPTAGVPAGAVGPASLDEKARAAAALFSARFGRPARFVVAAPGRVNLIGEHTDYNDGFVFPMAIDRHTVVAGAPAPRGEPARIKIYSQSLDAETTIPLARDLRPGDPTWANYVRGVIVGFLSLDLALPSLDLVLTSDVPLGAGLSSSAALEVAIATAFEAALGNELPPMTKARLCQEAEHNLAQVPCGIMDQATSALAREGMVLLIDCGDETVRAIPLPDRVAVVITNTGVKHALDDGAYARRRSECNAAAHALGVTSLRATSPAAVLAASHKLDPILFKRANHVVNENVRTLATAAALLRDQVPLVGGFMYESHRSLRDDFEVSCPELDGLVEIAKEIGEAGGVIGARMTGGGFGGSTVTLVETAAASSVMARLAEGYEARFGRTTAPFLARPSRGAHIIHASR